MRNNDRHQREHGQVLVLFGIGVVGLLALVALVLDGGYLYVQRRTAQTAADAAALAGTAELSRALSPTGNTSIATVVCTFAQSNSFGITPTITQAYFVDTNGNQITGYPIVLPTACGGTGGTTGIPWGGTSGANGVHVDINIPYQTLLAGMIGVSNLAASASATGQVGIATAGDARNAPLIVCGGAPGGSAERITDITPQIATTTPQMYGSTPASLPTIQTNGPPVTPEILLATPGPGQPTMPAFYPDPARDGHVYYLKGQALGTAGGDCSVNGFKGGANPTQTPTDDWVNLGSGTPVVMVDLQGNKVPQINGAVTAPGACASGLDPNNWSAGNPGCVMWLPVANNGSTPLLDVQAWGAFYVWCGKDAGPNHCQEFVGQYLANWKVGGPAVNAWRAGQGGGSVVVHLGA